MINNDVKRQRLRLHVAIACYGNKNIQFLKRVIQTYRKMRYEVDVTVISEGPKDVGDGAKVVVGLPSKNPWSLPFAHKAIFAQSVDKYDLFVYSEDDMLVTEANIEAFLRITPFLAPDEIAGFLRYEVCQDGEWNMPDFHGAYHWNVKSVRRRGENVIAEFTNEHAAFYILTQAQLRRAIQSGGFLRGPYEGRYDMLCTVATDPYTSCGMRKVICISRIDDFLIHHLSNRYVGGLGISLTEVREEITTLMMILDNKHPACTLYATESKVLHSKWSKRYDEHPRKEFLAMVPEGIRSVLSVGCGRGATEALLKERGADLTILPLDSVAGAARLRSGFRVVYGTLGEGLETLRDERYDCVMLTNLLHLLPKPGSVIEACAQLVRLGGVLVIGGPNFDFYRVLIKRVLGMDGHWRLRSFDQSGITVCGPKTIRSQLERDGFHIEAVEWFKQNALRNNTAEPEERLGPFTGRDWLLRARRTGMS